MSTRPIEPWGEGWGDPAPLVRRPPPGVLVRGPGAASFCCAACPGADAPRCCRHGEWRAERARALRGELGRTPEGAGRRGAGRRAWLVRQVRRFLALESGG